MEKFDYHKEYIKLNDVKISEYTGNTANLVHNNSGFQIKAGSLDHLTTHITYFYHVFMVKSLSKGYDDRQNWKEKYIKFVVPLKH